MNFAIIYHPEDLNQVRLAYPLLRRVPDNLVRRFLPSLPPCSLGSFHIEEGCSGQTIICPLLPEHLEILASGLISKKINSCLRKAEKSGAQVVGLEGLLGFCFEGRALELKPVKARLTGGLLLGTVALMRKARLMAERSGLAWAQNNVVLAGALGQEGEAWIKLLAQEAKSLILTTTDTGWDKGFVSKVIYETGLALKATTDCGRALSQADVIFLHHLRPEDIKTTYKFKPGAVVCSILPYSGWKEKLQGRRDISYIEPPITFSCNYPGYPEGYITLAEILIQIREQTDESNFAELKYSGRDITIKQIQLASSLTEKYGLQVI